MRGQDFWCKVGVLQHHQKEILAKEFSKTENGQRADLHSQQFFFVVMPLNKTWQGKISWERSRTAALLPVGFSSCQVINISATLHPLHCSATAGAGMVHPWHFQGAVTCWITTVGTWGSVLTLSLGFSTGKGARAGEILGFFSGLWKILSLQGLGLVIGSC